MKNILKLLAFIVLFTSCEDLFDPAKENIRKLDAMYKEPGYAQGILGNGYALLPYNSDPATDLATDDAVTNVLSNMYVKMATGSWSSNYNPVSTWEISFNAIQYLNIFLENADSVVWSTDANISAIFNDRLKGEAYGLRAVHMYFLLRAHAGIVDGQLMGVPILSKSLNPQSDFNLPRNTFQQCMDQLISDADKAIELLPLDYQEIKSSDQIPEKYRYMSSLKFGDYDRVVGKHLKGRISGRIVEAVRAQASLLAASPAYTGTNYTWENAANYAATVLDRINGANGLAAKGGIWYTKDEVDKLESGNNPAEMIWRGDVGSGYGMEAANFPESLFGSGRTNPTQNLVDAFPMVNGYPISDPASNFDPANPYQNRDPRLSTYIVVNESKLGPNSKVIVTGTYGTNKDAINRENGISTRTGYYMRKLLREDCNPDPAYKTGQKHYTARIRYTEIFLAYAEAANEAWGPTGTGGHAYSAYDVIKAIRKRAGIGADNNDAYLESVKGDQVKMRELIHNERRLELCFENMRFWDLRRWKAANLNETATGMQIDKPGSTLNYNLINVEARNYKDYMYYGPIPYVEMLKWSNLKQNTGW